MTKRFAAVSNDDLNNILSNKTAKSTDYNTKNACKLFEDYCHSEKLNYKMMSKEELNETLSKFYVGARRSDGEKYRYQSLQQLRFALNRYFKDTMNINIIHDPEFQSSCTIFNCLSKTLKREGLGSVTHHANISLEDFKLINSKLSEDTPVQLQYKSWVYIMLYFARRGGENLVGMTKDSLKISTTADGRRCIKPGTDEATKNHQISTAEESIGGRILCYRWQKLPCCNNRKIPNKAIS